MPLADEKMRATAYEFEGDRRTSA